MNGPTDPSLIIESAEPAIDDLHPWLGLASFSEETRRYFYGREDEVGELSRRVQRKLLTVLFGQSGLGKTSILRAGIVPRLREQGYCPVYVRIDYGVDAPAPAQQIRQAIFEATTEAGNATSFAPQGDESLWEFLHHRDDVIADANGKPLIPLLIFDQFEEVFTLAQGDAGGRERAARFVEGLAELVENRPSRELEARLEEDDAAIERYDFARSDYRILITLREDYLAHLEGLKAQMPSITQNRMRLAPMTGQQALAAVTGPGGALVSGEVAEAIVRFVAGGTELAHAQVEPSLLSLICRELNDKRIAAGRREISLDLLAGSHASILTDFYERALADQPDAVRSVIEDVLLTDSGYRENVAEERVLIALTAAGAAPDALAILVNRRLLRIEERLDVRRVELTHDVLCSVVSASRNQRQEREALAAAARKQVAQDERERATRRALARSRRITAFSLVLASVAVISTVFGYVKLQESKDTRALAETTRADAEKLVGYLLEDFHAELEPVGRLDMIGELAGRTVAYYRALAPSMRTADTEANRALALLRLGDVQRVQGKPDEAAATLDEAIAALEPLLEGGKAPHAVQLTLSQALYARGLVAYSGEDRPTAKSLHARAVSMAEPLAVASDASLQARRVYATALTRVGYIKMRDLEHAGAQTDMRAALAAVNIGTAVANDMRTAVVYSDTAAWLQEELSRFSGDHAGGERVAQDALGVASNVLEQRPNHVVAMRIIERIQFNRADSAEKQGHHQKALTWLAEADLVSQALLRIEPGNQQYIDMRAINRGVRARALVTLGRPLEAIQAADEAFALYAAKAPSAYQSGNMAAYAALMALTHAELDQARQLASTLERLSGYAEKGSGVGTDPELREAWVLYWDGHRLSIAAIAGDPSATGAAAAALLARVERFESGESQESRKTRLASYARRVALGVDARLAYARGDYARAEASSRLALELAIGFQDVDRDDAGSEASTERTQYALALARLGRLPDARAQVALALAEQRRRIAAGSDDQMLRLELAQSLYALAWTQPDGGAKELKEAAQLLDGLPGAMQPYRTVRLWRERIAQGTGPAGMAVAGARKVGAGN
jgi:hypothetical protein